MRFMVSLIFDEAQMDEVTHEQMEQIATEMNEFNDELRKAGVDEVVVCGMMTSMCVDATVRAAVDLGFATTVAHDACATCELDFGGVPIPAASVHAAFLAALADGYAAVVSTDEIAG